jgi:hypothetical protein
MMLKNQGYSIAFTSEASASAMLILMMWNWKCVSGLMIMMCEVT